MGADLFTGAVVLADVKNPREKIGCDGKIRPAVLINPCGTDHWMLIGLTTQPFFKTTRRPRVKVWASLRNGLRSHGYLWGPKPTRVPTTDVARVIGVVDEHLAEVIAANCDIGDLAGASLRAAARRNPRAAA